MNQNKKSLLAAHISVLLFGLSGIFGKLLALPSLIITLGRVFFSSIALLLTLLFARKSLRLKKQKRLLVTGCPGRAARRALGQLFTRPSSSLPWRSGCSLSRPSRCLLHF